MCAEEDEDQLEVILSAYFEEDPECYVINSPKFLPNAKTIQIGDGYGISVNDLKNYRKIGSLLV